MEGEEVELRAELGTYKKRRLTSEDAERLLAELDEAQVRGERLAQKFAEFEENARIDDSPRMIFGTIDNANDVYQRSYGDTIWGIIHKNGGHILAPRNMHATSSTDNVVQFQNTLAWLRKDVLGFKDMEPPDV